MGTGAITGYIDVAQLVLYGFWIFFIGLIVYLRREDKREGYPLESERPARSNRVRIQGFPAMPGPKVFRLAGGKTVVAPNPAKDQRTLQAEPVGAWSGAALQPTGGNPLLSGVGPASWVTRAPHPEMTLDGLPLIVPLRVATDFSVAPQDPDPRGMSVVGADGVEGGVVQELWVDRSEPQVRYLEIEVAGARRVLLPMTLVRINNWRRRVTVQTILGRQFADVPGLANPDQVTLTEEDQICAYYAGGTLYAEPSRQEPLI